MNIKILLVGFCIASSIGVVALYQNSLNRFNENLSTGLEQYYLTKNEIDEFAIAARKGDSESYYRLVEYFVIFKGYEHDDQSRLKLLNITRIGIRNNFRDSGVVFLKIVQHGDTSCREIIDVYTNIPIKEKTSYVSEFATNCLQSNESFKKQRSNDLFVRPNFMDK